MRAERALKVLFFTEGTRTSAASRIRVYNYLDYHRQDQRIEARTVSFTSESYTRRIVSGKPVSGLRRLLEKFYQLLALLRLALGALSADVVLIQRVLLPVGLQRLIRRLNPRLAYDFDDAVYLGGGRSPDKRFALQLALARRVIAVSRAALEEAAARGAARDKLAVLPSPVDTAAYKAGSGRDDALFTIGWVGSPATTPYLESIWPQLEHFAGAEARVRFLFIGARPFDTGAFAARTSFLDWSPEAETKELCRLDAGLMPLKDDLWCRGKGGYKLIQYMAAGAACLASPVGANLEIVVEGVTGYFVRGEQDWETLLARLLADRGHCRALGEAGRKRALELYDYSVLAPQFFYLLEEIGSLQP